MVKITNITKLEVEVAGKIYQFICDQDAQVGPAKEALLKFLGHCMELEKATPSATSESRSENQCALPPNEESKVDAVCP